jgi:formyl-CoA transferase
MLADAHFKARQAIVKVLHPRFGELNMQNVAPKLSDTPGAIIASAPDLGQHNREVYEGILKLSRVRIEALVAAGVIGPMRDAGPATLATKAG